MKYFFFTLIVMFYSACNTSQSKPEKIKIQNMKDSAHYSNKQLAYIKKDNTVKFYTPNGKLQKELNLLSGIEKRYNITGEIIEYDTSYRYMQDLGAGYFSYPDAYIIPQGTKVGMGKTGMMSTAEDETVFLPKNNLGYPIAFKFNETGQIIEHHKEKMEYDETGRLLSKTTYYDEKVYKKAKYVYENNQLLKSLHEGQNEHDNYIKEYNSNALGQLNSVLTKKEGNLTQITKYNFDTEFELLKSKKEYSMIGSSLLIKVSEYTYNDIRQLTQEEFYNIETPSGTISLMNISKDNYDKAVYNSYKFNKKVKTYSYDGDKLISSNMFDKSSSTSKLLWKNNYIYNTKDQLIKVQNEDGKTSKLFSYKN